MRLAWRRRTRPFGLGWQKLGRRRHIGSQENSSEGSRGPDIERTQTAGCQCKNAVISAEISAGFGADASDASTCLATWILIYVVLRQARERGESHPPPEGLPPEREFDARQSHCLGRRCGLGHDFVVRRRCVGQVARPQARSKAELAPLERHREHNPGIIDLRRWVNEKGQPKSFQTGKLPAPIYKIKTT